MGLIKYFFRQSPWAIVFASLTGIAGGLCGTALVAVIGKGVSGSTPLQALVGTFFALCIAHLVFKTTSEVSVLRLTQAAIARSRVSLSRKLLRTPQKRLQKMGKARLLVILTRDIDTLSVAAQMLPVAFADVVVILGCLGYMAWLSLQIFVTVTAVLLLGTAFYRMAERIPLRKLARAREQTDVLYQHFRGLVEGSRELQLNQKRSTMFVDEVIAPEVDTFRKTMASGMSGYVTVANVGTIIFYVCIGLVMFQIPSWQQQSTQVSATITLMLLYLIRPIADLISMAPMLQQAAIALGKMQQLDHDLGDADPSRAVPDPFVGQAPLALTLHQVCHQYTNATADREFMLGPIDLTVSQGEVLFIVGGNGSGKTTLAMLLLGLYEPESGEMRLNGQRVTAENRQHYRQHFSVVFADFYLFEHLLHDESPEAAERIAHYLRLFCMAEKVSVVNGRFSTVDLSSGQRKRLALLSVYLEDRPIYLFDEWAADQDPVFKRLFYTELLPDLKSRGKTVIAITHDDAYFHCADRVIKVEDGQLAPLHVPQLQAARELVAAG